MERLQLSVEKDIKGLELFGRNDQEVDLLRSTKFFMGVLVTGPEVWNARNHQHCFASFIRIEKFLDPCLR
ncbi:hypothetical protein L596_017782 [Steinernema carpocapsae]|uniref:Uncharacterized protein n=1 Tax=Steinernema carpocapsae TaxID=34508 RepID=A0A4U5N3D5_STECR|nr:hypothetical protein L596_017782 [Steinernema carpocapsae]